MSPPLVWAVQDKTIGFDDFIREDAPGQDIPAQMVGQRQCHMSGDVKREWRHYAVEDLISEGVIFVGDGYRAKRSELAKAGLPFARAGDVNNGFQFQGADRFPERDLDRVGVKVSQPGDVVFTSKGTVGRFAFVRKDTERFVYAPQLSFWRVLNREVIEPRFLHYWMFGREFYSQYYGLKAQTDMADYVSLRDQRRMHITLPPLSEQKEIAAVLGALDDKIELNHQMNHTLEATAQAIFKSWFVDFDPVWAKVDGEQPYGMDAETAALFPDAFVDSELGPIPEGWHVAKVGELGVLLRDSIRPSEYPNEVFDHYSIPAFTEGRQPKADAGAEIKSNKYAVRPGSVLVSKLNPHHMHRVWLPHLSDVRRSICSTEYLAVFPQANVSREYLYALFSSRWFLDMFVGLVTGTSSSHQRVRPSDFLEIDVLVPPDSLVASLTEFARPLHRKIAQGIEESRVLSKLRDTLLPKLISGQLRIPNVEKHLSEAT